MITVRPVRRGDAESWCRMRHDLWREESAEEHASEIAAFLDAGASEPLAVLVAEEAGGELVGLAELSIRSCAEGCATDRVAYLEGWYVAPNARRRGVGRTLIRAVEQWARGQGCTELASDTAVDNDGSRAAHRAAGFEEVGLVRCFRKLL